jgi:hypothetical protein
MREKKTTAEVKWPIGSSVLTDPDGFQPQRGEEGGRGMGTGAVAAMMQ